VMLTRGGQARMVTADTVAQEGDAVLFAVRTDALDDLERQLGPAAAAAR
jgi:Trk K+ transport system NAD-binding subunit